MKINKSFNTRNAISKSWLWIILLAFVFPIHGCSDDDDVEISDRFMVLALDSDFGFTGGSKTIGLWTELDTGGVTCEIAENGKDWCSAVINGKSVVISAEPNYYEITRSTFVTVRGHGRVREITVNQKASEGSADVIIPITGGKATSEEADSEDRRLIYSYDGNYSTYFNSKFGAVTTWPFEIEYTLQAPNQVDYIAYYPRPNTGTNVWGSFGIFDVWVTTTESPNNFVFAGTFDHKENINSPSRFKLETPLKNVTKVRIDVQTAGNNRVSCAQIEFIQENQHKFDYGTVFADELYTSLRDDVTEAQIRKMPDKELVMLALSLYNNAYNTEFRVGEFRPYQDPSIMANLNKTGTYSIRDNPTGIYVESGDELTVVVRGVPEGFATMVVQDLKVGFGSSKSYRLAEGVNKVSILSGGLIYFVNIVEDDFPLIPETQGDKDLIAAKTIKAHFVHGKINGYFDKNKHDAGDWSNMIRTAKYHDMDVVGDYAHITWNVTDFAQFNTDILRVINCYDQLVYGEMEFMGLVKYGKMFRNRMYFHIDYNGASPYATGNRTAYTPGYAEVFCNPDRFPARLWGPAHEAGHINQTRPGLKWAGLTEVSNNIMSLNAQVQFGVVPKLTADNAYVAAKEAIIDTGEPHCLNNGSNEFIHKLVPFWQLKLYLVDGLGQTDFFKDLYEYHRVTPNLATGGLTEGILQLDFVRQTCALANLNLLDFFRTWGFLTPVDRTFNDYGNKRFTITQEQIDALVTEITGKNYPMPAHNNIHEITDTNVDDYR